MSDSVVPYQSFACADGSSSPHIGGFHCAEEVAGVPVSATMLSAVSTAVPPLQDVATWNQVIVSSQIKH